MSNSLIIKQFDIPSQDFLSAGEASSEIKKILKQIGIKNNIIKRISIAMYEAELNVVIHGGGGKALVEIKPEYILINISDNGPGIEDVDLAMQEGYSTASDKIREMGFGAGMGLPNIKKHADDLKIDTKVGKGTKVTIKVMF